jgi:MoaA/NifB/PqqE/SkfB family radical SAM enzyme
VEKGSRPVFKKHNSFVEIRHHHADALSGALSRVIALRAAADVVKGLSPAHARILQQVFADLLDSKDSGTEPRFALTPHVVEEIATLVDEELPRYLVHRYRYEMFPQQKVVDDYPPYLQIEPTSVCNFRCVFCFETDPTFTNKANGFMGRMNVDLFKEIVDQAHGQVEFVSLASRGEPLLYPDIIPMLEYTRGKFLNLKMNTNASLLDEAKCHAILQGGVRTLVFSADAAAEPLYSQLRVNGKLSVVMANIERFQRIRETQYAGTPMITRVSGVKMSDDQEIDAMERTWGGLVDQVAFVQYNPWENVYNEAINDITAPCSDLWRRMFVWWDGKVNPCDVDYKSTLSVGTFPQRTLSELWGASGYASLRDSHLQTKRGNVSPCNRCTVV